MPVLLPTPVPWCAAALLHGNFRRKASSTPGVTKASSFPFCGRLPHQGGGDDRTSGRAGRNALRVPGYTEAVRVGQWLATESPGEDTRTIPAGKAPRRSVDREAEKESPRSRSGTFSSEPEGRPPPRA